MIQTLHTPGQQGVEPDVAIVEQLVTMERTLFGPEAWNESMLRQEFGSPARTYLLDLVEGTDHSADVVRAYGGFWHDGTDAELMTIGVDPAYQRRGVGTALLQALIEQARRKLAERMLLEVRVDNTPALTMYRRFGFVPLGVRKRYYQPEGVDAYTMALQISRVRQTDARSVQGKDEEQHTYE